MEQTRQIEALETGIFRRAAVRIPIHPIAVMDHINVPVSFGELVDKLTILEIKGERIADPSKLVHVREELNLLNAAVTSAGLDFAVVAQLKAELKTVNERLWQIEDEIREKERRREFDPEFIALARAVYVQNDA